MSAKGEGGKQEPETKVALSDSEERFRLLIDSQLDYSVFPLSVDGRVTNWNLGAERLKGYQTEEALGLHISRFFPEAENAERVPERILRRAQAEGRAEYEGWLVRKDGSRFWGSVSLGAMRDQDGRLCGFSNVARDLSERKRSEVAQAFLSDVSEALTGSLEYERTLQEVARLAVRNMADWCMVAIQSGRGLTVMSVAHADPAREAQAQALLRVLPASEPQQAHGIAHVVRTGGAELCADTQEAAWVRSALGVGSPELLMSLGARSYMCVPLQAHGDILGAIAFVRSLSGGSYTQADLSLAQELARRAALAVDNARLFRKAQDALKARDEFLSMASHDLRSPLTSLRLQLQLLRRELESGGKRAQPPEKVAVRVESMERQTERMLHMMDGLLDITQMTAGRLELKRQRQDLVEVVGGVVARLDEELRQAGVQVQVHAKGPIEGEWDRMRLEQVIDNLLTNAVKYGEGRPVHLTLSTDGAVATLIVRDQGVGIAPEDQERLFDRFERVRLDRDVNGYGVGLWIVRRVVEAHGGATFVDSRLGQGASFTVQLPLHPRRGVQGPERPAGTEPRPSDFH